MNKFFLISLILGIFLLSLISAEVTTTVNAYYAEIQEDGSMLYTNTPVTDFQTLGYVCLNSDCSSVGAKIDNLTKNSVGNSVTLKFPTTLQNANGYGIWFYKPGYIQWEQKANFYGNNVISAPLNIYLVRKQVAWAPIMNMHVVNDVHPNIPVEVGLNVSIDADTYSALENAGPLKYNPLELDSLNVVETTVNLKIKDSTNNVIYADRQTFNISYSDYETVLFNYTGFSSTGVYDVEFTTSISDQKIISSLSQFSKTEIRVIPVGLTDYSFSLMGGLSIDPVSPERNENIDFNINYNSSYVDLFGALTKLDTNVSVRVYKDGVKISEENSTQLGISDLLVFSKSFSSLGNYTIVVEGTPSICLGVNGCLPSLQEISFVIKENPPLDITPPAITILSPVDGSTYNVSDILLHLTTDETANVWFSLNGGANVILGSGTDFQYNLTGLNERIHTLNVYAKDLSNNQIVSSISFTVDLPGTISKDKKSSGSRYIVSNLNPLTNNLTSNVLEELPLQIDLKINSERSYLTQLIFWILLSFTLILIIICAILIVKKIN